MLAATESKTTKSLVTDYYRALYSASAQHAVQTSLGDNYVEHQVTAGFSKEGLLDYVQTRIAENPQQEIIIHRIIAQEDMVFLHVEEKLTETISFARAELFRIEDGKIVEHWGTEQEVPDRAVHANGMFDGPNVDLNISLPEGSVEELTYGYFESFVNFDIEASHQNAGSGMIQHNPEIPDGIDALGGFLELMQANNMQPDLDIKRTLTEGNFIVTHSFINIEPMFGDAAVFDIFRMNPDGKKEEHWDVLMAIPTEQDIEKMF